MYALNTSNGDIQLAEKAKKPKNNPDPDSKTVERAMLC